MVTEATGDPPTIEIREYSLGRMARRRELFAEFGERNGSLALLIGWLAKTSRTSVASARTTQGPRRTVDGRRSRVAVTSSAKPNTAGNGAVNDTSLSAART